MEVGVCFPSKDWEMPKAWIESSNGKWGSKLKDVTPGPFGPSQFPTHT